MRSKRMRRTTSIVVDLDPGRCVDTADHLARHADRYGIDAPLEFRASRSGRAYDRHYVLCHRRGATEAGSSDFRRSTPRWILELVVRARPEERTEVLLTLHSDRRLSRLGRARRAAADYTNMLREALALLDAGDRPDAGPDEEIAEVVVLRPYVSLPPTGSA